MLALLLVSFGGTSSIASAVSTASTESDTSIASTAAATAPTTTASAPLFTLHLYDNATFPLATALDGTQGGFYIRPAGSPQGATRWKIFFQGACA